MKIEAWYDSNIGRVRKSNQDTIGCFPDAALFVVADGMGGRAEGEVASRLATEVIHATVVASPSISAEARGGAKESSASTTGEELLRRAIGAANRRVFDEGQTREPSARGSMGTTVVVLRCDPPQRRFHWAYVGDSRLYRTRQGHLTLLTADHTAYGEAYLDEEEIPSDLPHSNMLVRAVGINPEVEVSTGADDLLEGDLFLLCSDGVSGMVGATDLEAEMVSGRALCDIGGALIARALDAGGRDNASALLVKVRF